MRSRICNISRGSILSKSVIQGHIPQCNLTTSCRAALLLQPRPSISIWKIKGSSITHLSPLRYFHSSTSSNITFSQSTFNDDKTSNAKQKSNSASSSSSSQSHLEREPIEGATDLSHAHFISSASPKSDFNPKQIPEAGQDLSSLTSSELNSPSTKSPNNANNGNNDDQELKEFQGKLSPTSSHLFKLVIPLPTTSMNSMKTNDLGFGFRQTAFLLHPSQPLSHLSRLIIGSLPKHLSESEITFLSVTGEAKDIDQHLRNAAEEQQDQEEAQQNQNERDEGGPHLNERENSKGRFQEVSWSQSTDLSDFIKQSCLNEQFKIVISPNLTINGDESFNGNNSSTENSNDITLEVIIPSFSSRTHYIRRRLLSLTKELDRMTKQKKQIDYTAHKGAQKLAVAALGGGVVYWAAVIRWTFFTDAGWDLMEPVTWATGFAALLGSAAFLIYHNREVSYSSLLDLSITARQRKLYDQAGLDIEKWTEMVSEAKTLRREITRIASDYDIEWKGELENLADQNSSSSNSHKSISNKSKKEDQYEIGQNKNVGSLKSKDENSTDSGKEEKLDIDATIQEASELAEQSESNKSKEKSAQRKGQVIDSSKKDDDNDRGSLARKGQEKESESEIKGRKKAKEIIDT
ncbi:uncharacterized protein L201_004510 [Kwoniella dendrophila CBS 6074]|uniref:Calcium uniporter protein, mitochondrial n=1 Tax=Kwoniella dendrophila CBS 6074 TaxID=1295534 RepID=A0AAX4JYC7_9TREE